MILKIKTIKNMNYEEINDEFRMIISHALLGCDTSNIDRKTWELVLDECTKYAIRLADNTSISDLQAHG
jgi:hypothetical protein